MAALISKLVPDSDGLAPSGHDIPIFTNNSGTAMTRIAVSVLVLLMSSGASGHHSIGVFFDSEASIEISGTITSVTWANPHIRFMLESVNEANEREVWSVSAGSVNSLERNGIRRDQVKLGSEVTVVGRPSRLGRPEVYAAAIRTPDGGTIVLQGQFGELQAASAGLLPDTTSAAGARSKGMFRVWTKGRAYGEEADDSPTGMALAYTPTAVAARDRYNPVTDDSALKCIPQGMPGIMDNPFPIELVERDGNIVLRAEEWDTVRTIHMSGGADPEAQPATPLGYSVGRWEDATLVVTTTWIDWPYFDDVGTPQSADIETIERFSLSADETRLNYTITVTDSTTFTGPVTLDGYWVWVPGQEIKPYNCTL